MVMFSLKKEKINLNTLFFWGDMIPNKKKIKKTKRFIRNRSKGNPVFKHKYIDPYEHLR